MKQIAAQDVEEAAEKAATWTAALLTAAVNERGSASLALSGGSSPLPYFVALASKPLQWSSIDVFQVDERWTTSNSGDRNWTAIHESLVGVTRARGHPLTVGDSSPDTRMANVAQSLVAEPDVAALRRVLGEAMSFDVVHLGLGSDGHTASWAPGDQLGDLLATSAPLAVVLAFNGFDRTTLTPALVNRSRSVVWFVTGAEKAPVVRRLLLAGNAVSHDPTGEAGMPAGHVTVADQRLFTDFDSDWGSSRR